jgi:hypothetical protein
MHPMSNSHLSKHPKVPKTPIVGSGEWATAVRQVWERKMAEVSQSATDAWDTGRTFYTTTARIESADGIPSDDVAGILQMVESVGWRLDSSDYVSSVRLVIPGGVVGFGGIGVLGKDPIQA